MQKLNFTTINHIARKELELSMNEYAVADLVYHLSNNPKNETPGWCYSGKKNMGKMIDLSEQSVHKILNSLIVKKLIEKHQETKHLRATSKWYEIVVAKESLVGLKKVEPVAKESLVGAKESLVGHIYNNNINNNTYKGGTLDLTFNQKRILKQKYPNVNVDIAYDKFRAYQRGNGRTYKNPLEAFRVWLIEDNTKNKPKKGILYI